MQEIRATTEIYPSEINIHEAEKDVINSWFDYRYVADNDNFVRFFQRVLIRDYGRYRELLRIEPNISKYDWLVQQYMESQTYNKGSDVTGNNGTTTDTTSQETTTANTGSVNTNEHDLSSVMHVVNANDGENNTIYRDTSHSGADNTTDVSSNTTNGTTHSASSGSDSNDTYNHTNNKTLAKEQPMSVTYENGMSIDDFGDIDSHTERGNRGVLNWSYPSNQGEQDTRSRDNSTTNYGKVDDSQTNQTSNTSGTNSVMYGHNISEETTELKQRHHTENNTDTNSGDKTTTGSTTENGTTNIDGTSTHNTSSETVANRTNLTQHINSGRAIDTATLLSQARAYIINSSAMAWLCERLEVCFMGVYNDDSNDYNF